MSDTPPKDDELLGTEQPFVQHLMELRDRLVKAALAVGIMAAVLFLFPGPGALYDLLAAPLVAHLPKGATLIATSVISPFMVPLKILLMSAFLLALPVVLWQIWGFVAPGLYMHEKKLVVPLVDADGALVGVFDITKVGSQAWTVGAKIYWDDTNKRCTTVATDNTLIGVAVEAVASGASDTIGRVRLNAAF